jgi:DNA adenine methylase
LAALLRRFCGLFEIDLEFTSRIETDAMDKKELQAAKSLSPTPFLKWAGGKRGLLHEILPRIPSFDGTYIEPFVGAGAVLFNVPCNFAIANDFNSSLIEVYKVIRRSPTALLAALREHKNTKEHYLAVRALDRSPGFSQLSPAERAARFIFLNKTGFNGLHRVNSQGFFNVPFGAQANPDFIAEENILRVSAFLKKVTFMSGDYRAATKLAKPGDFVYLDPPYDPISDTASFVAYSESGFTKADQTDLRDEMLRLTEEGVPVLLSNSDTPFIRALYSDTSKFRITSVTVRRAISAKSSGRGMIGEVLVDNYVAVGVAS